MSKRILGQTGLQIEPLVFGGNVFGWTADEAMSFSLLDAFVGAGFTMVDTADVYSIWGSGNRGGESETIIGKWLSRRRRRNEIILATKVGWELSPTEKGLRKTYIVNAVDKSLERLNTDYIDLYQSHIDDPTTPVEETLEAYAKLIRQGKVRFIGASNFTATRLQESLDVSSRHGYPRYEVLQPLYNLIDRKQFETELAPICHEESLAVITYFSLASGFLTGKYRSERDLEGRLRSEEVKKHITRRNIEILKALDVVGSRLNYKPSQIAIAWLLSRPTVTAPVVSATNLVQLSELVTASEINLDEDSKQILDDASAWHCQTPPLSPSDISPTRRKTLM
jgi:aryl-alcohol dehydrogenase-like predicted oxidoreductase